MANNARSKLCALLLVLAFALPGTASAQSYPTKTVHFVTGLTVGLDTDTTMRLIARQLALIWGQSAVIFNRPGAGANIAANIVAKSAPDGYHLLLATDSLALSPAYFKSLPYSAAKDLVPITQVTALPSIMCVKASLPVHSVKDLIALAKSKPNSLTYGSVGVGSLGHLAAAWLDELAGIKMRHIPYDNGPSVYRALIKGDIDVDFGGIHLAVPLAKAGKIRCIAVTTPKRSPAVPNIPTVGETVPGYAITLWSGIFAPTGTPQSVIHTVQTGIAKALKVPVVEKRMAQLGETGIGSTPAQFGRFFHSELKMWAHMIARTGIREGAPTH